MITEQNSLANVADNTAGKTIELSESDLAQMTGGTASRGVVEADPCAGGRARLQ